jgi:hypothetical protein
MSHHLLSFFLKWAKSLKWEKGSNLVKPDAVKDSLLPKKMRKNTVFYGETAGKCSLSKSYKTIRDFLTLEEEQKKNFYLHLTNNKQSLAPCEKGTRTCWNFRL